jgi:hypothetical protein
MSDQRQEHSFITAGAALKLMYDYGDVPFQTLTKDQLIEYFRAAVTLYQAFLPVVIQGTAKRLLEQHGIEIIPLDMTITQPEAPNAEDSPEFPER